MAEELKQSAIERIAQGVVKGPLLLLRKCYNEGGRVRVVSRHARGIRGAATGAGANKPRRCSGTCKS